MKKQITLFASLLIATGTFAQVKSLQEATLRTNDKLFLGDKMPQSNKKSNTKAAGDILWSNNFNTSTNWLGTAIGATPSPGFGWEIASAPDQILPWAFNAGISSTSAGGYAIVQNGDPTLSPGTQIPNTEWFLTFDSIFDLSAVNNVILQFEEYGAAFIDNQTVEASNDGGVSWVEIGNNDDLGQLTSAGGSAFPNPTLRQYNVSQAFNSAPLNNLKFRFRVYWPSNAGGNSGVMYGWFVDDIKFIEGFANDLKMNTAFNFTGTQLIQYSKFPISQAVGATTTFSANVANIGSASQNVILNVSNGGSFNQNSSPVVMPGFLKDSILIAGPYTIPSTVGISNFAYSATSNNSTLDNTNNDALSLPFETTSKVMAVDAFTDAASINGGFFGWATPTGNPAIGAAFEIFANESAGAIQIGIAGVNAADQPTYVGRIVYGQIHVLNTTTNEFDFVAQTPDHFLLDGEFSTLLTLPFETLIPLTAGNLYLVSAASFDGSEVPIAFSGYIPQGNTLGFNGTTSVSLASNGTFGNTVTAPVVRLDFTSYIGLNELESVTDLSVSPNPFADQTTINFQLKTDETVSVTVRDLSGRIVSTIPASQMNAGKQSIAIDGSAFGAGVYNYTLKVGNSSVTKRMIKK